MRQHNEAGPFWPPRQARASTSCSAMAIRAAQEAPTTLPGGCRGGLMYAPKRPPSGPNMHQQGPKPPDAPKAEHTPDRPHICPNYGRAGLRL
eukprot:8105916-Pyramimonas_sp.AAC.1